MMRETDNLSRKNEIDRENSINSFKLPKIQKAGRILFSEKLSKSPYLRVSPHFDL